MFGEVPLFFSQFMHNLHSRQVIRQTGTWLMFVVCTDINDLGLDRYARLVVIPIGFVKELHLARCELLAGRAEPFLAGQTQPFLKFLECGCAVLKVVAKSPVLCRQCINSLSKFDHFRSLDAVPLS